MLRLLPDKKQYLARLKVRKTKAWTELEFKRGDSLFSQPGCL